ncbi:hypothetical protein M406DRAFT_217187, partial [Cryphonectria parasitica EP155]
ASSNQENHYNSSSPLKDKRRSRIMSGSEMSPLKMLQRNNNTTVDERLMPPNSPRKSISPMRRFPVRVNTGESTPRGGGGGGGGGGRPHQGQVQEREMSLDEAIAQNPGVRHAIEIFEDTLDSMGDEGDDEDTDTGLNTDDNNNHDESMADETMLSEFSTFSAIPNMTTFARLGGRTPTQMAQDATRGSNTTTNLLDFTDSLRFPGGRSSSPTRSMTAAAAAAAAAADGNKKTPQRQGIANLLDFEIPPMPTPRSVPSISARELESLKSNFMSEISSLRATLSGKEAEAASLKTALMDAEKRAGESGEQLREERSMREHYSEEKETWEKRGREMETVLRQVKEEIMTTQREREALEARLEESEGRREAAEMMAQEAESKMAAMRASKVVGADGNGNNNVTSPGGGGALKSPKTTASQREIEMAVEKVARELHAAYKSKHEAKVAALKKNYENRWDKKIREMEAKIDELTRENEELRVGRDATLTKVEIEAGERRDQAVRDTAEIKGLHAEVERLQAVLKTVQGDNDSLRRQLEVERVEKGELVTLAEELMQMQSNQTTMLAAQEAEQREATPEPPAAAAQYHQQQHQQHQQHQQYRRQPTPSGFRNSMIGRPGGMSSGLKAPSKIGGGGPGAAHQRAPSNVGGSGLVRPGSGLARPGGLMSSIQQMGSYRGR